ncbi:EAL domain-containing protein [Alteribacter natronophilus]|uniref:EAL domain-containing protein n=1 Tax=Alteribacter natronophilus TaxID=2583810 RepID=UPI00110D69C5|nr:EAL-associated domain-containing protein [Alteribacter natronophilus]TMW73342.1 EAL domain-containing protein [Alteribacter natronophilus]
MDTHDAVQNEKQVKVIFHPVLSSEVQVVDGYEVTGMYRDGDKYRPVRPLLDDPAAALEDKWEVSRLIYDRSFSYYLQQKESPWLFVNVHAGVLYEGDLHERFLTLAEKYFSLGLPRHKIILQFRQADFPGDPESLSHLLKFFTASGIRVAVDDLGRDGSDLDLISRLEPDLLKVDLSEIGNHDSAFDYRNVLESLALFSRKIGASLMFRGIEDLHHLYLAWRHGGQFMQGKYLLAPAETWVDKNSMTSSLREKMKSFINRENKRLQEQIAFVLDLDAKLARLEKLLPDEAGNDARAARIAKELGPLTFRVYSCDRFGYQLTSNWIKDAGENWSADEEAKGKNWSWRSYFLENLAQMEGRRAGILSDTYRDIDTNDVIRTYSYPLREDEFIFIDLSPSFLYDKDWLV